MRQVRMPSIASVLGFGLAILLISGCSTTKPQPIQVSAKPVDRPELTLPDADKLNLRDVEWVIVTEENYNEVVADLRKGGNVVLFGLTDKGYENLALNLSDIRAYIQQQNAIIAAYESYYKQSEQTINEANEQINKAQEEIKEQSEVADDRPFWKLF